MPVLYLCIDKQSKTMINIKGIIGEDQNTLVSVIAQIQKEQTENIHVLIDSIGGDLDEGLSIYNYLKNLKNVTTECQNNCASAASIIFLAGKNRIAGCPIMIHNPWTQAQGDSDELHAIAEFLREKESQLETIYASHTKVEAQVLSNLMDNETYISPSQAVSLGFATQAKQIALAKIDLAKITNKKTNSTQMAKRRKSSIFDFMSRNKSRQNFRTAFAMDLTTDEGLVLTIDREEGEPEVGDAATPDGTHIIDGQVIIVEEGFIISIEGASNQGSSIDDIASLLEEALAKIQELEDTNEEMKAQAMKNAKILNAVKMAGGIDKLAKGAKSTYSPQARLNRAKQMNANPLAERLEALKEERGIN